MNIIYSGTYCPGFAYPTLCKQDKTNDKEIYKILVDARIKNWLVKKYGEEEANKFLLIYNGEEPPPLFYKVNNRARLKYNGGSLVPKHMGCNKKRTYSQIQYHLLDNGEGNFEIVFQPKRVFTKEYFTQPWIHKHRDKWFTKDGDLLIRVRSDKIPPEGVNGNRYPMDIAVSSKMRKGNAMRESFTKFFPSHKRHSKYDLDLVESKPQLSKKSVSVWKKIAGFISSIVQKIFAFFRFFGGMIFFTAKECKNLKTDPIPVRPRQVLENDNVPEGSSDSESEEVPPLDLNLFENNK